MKIARLIKPSHRPRSPFYGPPSGENTAPVTPTITATESVTSALLSGSAFSDVNEGDTHLMTDWQVTTTADSGYASVVTESLNDTVNLVGFNAGGLTAETGYRCRCRYKDSAGNWSEYSTDDTFTTNAAGVAEATIDVAVTRLAVGTGSALCSTGIPLAPGLLETSETDLVKVTINSVEQQIYVEALSGLHSDGTLRSILVQFNISCDYGYPLSGTIDVGPGVSRSTEDISKTTITWDVPTIACTPTDPDYLISCQLVMPTIPVADVPASPAYLQQYDTEFVSYGDIHWNADEINSIGTWNSNYYDRALCWFTYWIRTGTFEYWRRGVLEADAYETWLTAAGGTDPHNQHLEGVEMLYTLVGSTHAKALLLTMGNYNWLFYNGSYIDEPGGEGRIQARVLMSYLLLCRINDTAQNWLYRAGTILTRTLATQNAVDGSYDGFSIWNYEHIPYMTALVNDAFIKYYTWLDADALIPPSIKAALDFEWDNMWMSGDESFKYRETSTSGSPDLNGLIVMGNIWYYAYSADSTYLTRANAIFQGAVDHAYLGAANNGFKQFNQTYRQGMQYFHYRLGSL